MRGLLPPCSSGFHFLEPAVEQVIRRVDFSWCLGDPVVAEPPGDAFPIVRREKLDQLLAEQACQAGAERINGVTVDDVARNRELWEVVPATVGAGAPEPW